MYYSHMEQKLEIEFKSKIDHQSHLLIRDYFPFKMPVLQENLYYDTQNRDFYKKGIMCRVRKIEDTYLLTVKEPHPEGIMEYEINLVGGLFEDPRAQEVLDVFNVQVDNLNEIAFSNTVRYEYADVYGTWCLDVTQFEHHKDYEIEYELYHEERAAQKHYLQTLKSIGIEFEAIEPKFVRALHSKEIKDRETLKINSDHEAS